MVERLADIIMASRCINVPTLLRLFQWVGQLSVKEQRDVAKDLLYQYRNTNILARAPSILLYDKDMLPYVMR